jgi:hypothetical protein
MALIIDNRNEPEMIGQPGLHIFIAGVSHYPHLLDDGENLVLKDFRMPQLSSTALSAFKIYQWLLNPNGRLPLPIATCRVLLSPSATEKTLLESAGFAIDECSRENFELEIQQWQKDAAGNKNNITIFYFAGHGIRRSTDKDTIMLLSDFGNPDEELFANTAGVSNIFDGMAPGDDFSPLANIARTQFYFIDCCRNSPEKLKDYEPLEVPKIFKPVLGIEDRHAPMFFAALSGTQAFALTDEQTFFSKALIECLKGGAGDDSGKRDENGKTIWHVSTATLNRVLSDSFKEVANLFTPSQEVSVSGENGGDRTINWLDDPPIVKAKVKVIPGLAINNVKVEFVDFDRNPSPHELDASENDLIRCRIKAGFYRVNARIEPPNANYMDLLDSGDPRKVAPPF